MADKAALRVPASKPMVANGSRRSGAATLAVAMLGNMASMTTVMVYSLGIFLGAFQREYGWSRADIALSLTFLTAIVFLGSAPIGRLADRFNAGRLAALSMFGFGLLLLAMPLLVHSVPTLWAGYTLLAIVGLGTSPAVMNRPVVSTFRGRVGLALGTALVGSGLGAFIAPQLTTMLIEQGGWRRGYMGLGIMALAISPLLWLVLGNNAGEAKAMTPSALSPARSFRDVLKISTFWKLSAIALFCGLGTSGPAVHLIPYLREHGLASGAAAELAAMLGLATIGGRIVAGLVLDKVKGPVAGLPLLGCSALGVALLAASDQRLTGGAIVLLGFGIGAQVDVLGYFTRRYFGLGDYSTIFGWTYGMIALGSAVAPVIVGALRDRDGDYGLGLAGSSVALVVAAFICLTLGRYPDVA